jgi:hypothetical protein
MRNPISHWGVRLRMPLMRLTRAVTKEEFATRNSMVDLTWKKDGRTYTRALEASADGKTLTETGSGVEVNEKYKAVYDKQ